MCIELVDEKRTEEFKNALQDLEITVYDNLGGICKSSILDINNKEITIE